MSATSPSYSSSSLVHPELRRYDVDPEPYVDADTYGYSYMNVGGAADTDAGYTPLLEKDYCTNFTCCGLTLADLHELVGHFEECHVMIVGPNGGLGEPISFPASMGMRMGTGSFPGTQVDTGMGTYVSSTGTHMGAGIGTPYGTPSDESPTAVTPQSSSNSAPSTAPSSSLNSPISPFTSPSPNPNQFPTLTSSFAPSETRECESAFASVTIATEGYDYSGGTAKDYLHTQNDGQNHDQDLSKERHALGLSFDTLLHPSAYTTSNVSPPSVVPGHTMYTTKPPPSSTTIDSPRSPAFPKTDPTANSMNPQPLSPSPIYACHPSLSIITDLSSVSTPISDRNGPTADRNSNSKRRRSASTKGVPRQREKTHKCPRPGCIKSYLNFNGLKYHLEKGTCDFGHN